MPSPNPPPKLSGSTCFTLPKCRIWRISLARNVLWHIVELSQTIAKCLRALVMATLILLLSPRNPTAPNVFDRTYFIEKDEKTCPVMLVHEQDQTMINIFTREIRATHFYETKKTKYRELCISSLRIFFFFTK